VRQGHQDPTWNHCGNLLQFLPPCLCTASFSVVFVDSPCTGSKRRPVDARIQVFMPSIRTLHFRSTRHQCGNFNPILAIVPLYHIFQLLSSSVVHLIPVRPGVWSILVESTILCHRLVHCTFVRPGTSTAISIQFLPPCLCTTSFRRLSSSAVHLPARPGVWSVLMESKFLCHRLEHCVSVRPGSSAAILVQILLP
jgi:hypothetical protein